MTRPLEKVKRNGKVSGMDENDCCDDKVHWKLGSEKNENISITYRLGDHR